MESDKRSASVNGHSFNRPLQHKGLTNKLIQGDNKLLLSSLKTGTRGYRESATEREMVPPVVCILTM